MNTFGHHLRLSIFGESHGPAVGIVLDGIPPGLPVSESTIARELEWRRPGASPLVSQRREPDRPELLSGIHEGRSTGAPLAMLIRNEDADAKAYKDAAQLPRAGHADYPSHVASRGFHDPRGAGHSSGRLTAPLVAAGAVAQLVLDAHRIRCAAHVHQVGDLAGPAFAHGASVIDKRARRSRVATAHLDLEAEFAQRIDAARRDSDSVGGVVEFAAEGVPAGLGAPFFASVESHLAQLLFAVPAVKGVAFGAGFAAAAMRGSAHNDAWEPDGKGGARPATNHAGGVLGGRTSGAPVLGHAAIKPASSLPGRNQSTVDLRTGKAATLRVTGRHDPCIAVRAAPAVLACLRLALADLALQGRRDGLLPVPGPAKPS